MDFERIGIIDQARLFKRCIHEAAGRTRIRQISSEDLSMVSHRTILMRAVSYRDRIKFARIVVEEIAASLRLDSCTLYPDHPVYLVSLADYRLCTAPTYHYPDLDHVRTRYEFGLFGLSYVGMIEPAYYVSSNLSSKRRQFLCWHVHALCWGRSAEEMRLLVDRLNNRKDKHRYIPVTSELKGAHCKLIPDRMLKNGSRTHLEDKVRYILKPPLKAYRISRLKRLDEDGRSDFNVKQWTDDLSPAETIRLFDVMKHYYLDDFLVGGGAGAKIVRRINKRALAQFNSHIKKKGIEAEPLSDRVRVASWGEPFLAW